MTASSPTVVRPSKNSISPLNKDSLGRQGASTTSSTTNRSASSMYGAMMIAVKEQQNQVLQSASEAKKKHLPQRPITPYGSHPKNVSEGNKAVSKKIIKKSRDESPPPASPRYRPTTPHNVRPVTPSAPKEKRTTSILKKSSPSQDTTPKRSVSPAPTSAHTTSHQVTAHRRSHERVPSHDKSLVEENRKLKRLLADCEERLREKENEFLESADIIEALSARVEKLDRENKSLREQIASSSDSTSNLLSAISNNYQRIRGDSPITTSISPSTTPTPDSSQFINPSSTPEILPSVAQKTISPPSVGKTTINNSDDVKEDSHVITPSVPNPVNSIRSFKNLDKTSMNQNLSPFLHRQTGIAGKQDLQYAKRAVAVKDVIMEDSDESEIDEFDPRTFNTDNNVSDNQMDSENEEDIDEIELPQGTLNLVGRNVKHGHNNIDHHEVSDYSNDEMITNETQHASLKADLEADVDKKMSPRRLRRPNINIIVEQAEDNSTNDSKNSLPNNNGQQMPLKVNGINSTQQRSQPRSTLSSKDHLSPYSHLHPHRDSMSSVTSDSSDESGLSKNESYSSPITSSSTTCTDSNNNNENGNSAHSGLTQSKINVLNALNSRAKNPVLVSKLNSNTSDDRCPTPVPTSQKNTSSGRPASRLSSQPSSTARSVISNSVDSNRSSSPHPALSHQRPSPNSGNPNKIGLTRPVNQIVAESKNRSSSPLHKQVTSNRPSTPARAQSPALTTSRASTPTSSQPRRSRLNENVVVDPSIPRPPPPPPSDDPFTTLQYYLRLIADYSIMDNPLKYYDLKQVIDEGSSAKVHTAFPLNSMNEEVAVKIIPLTYSLEFIFNEIYVLKNLKHKNIVDYKQSYLRWDGKIREVWLAMEKCARGDVTNRAGKITPPDFGIASLTPTSTTSMVGTIPYMAPDVVLVAPDRPYDTKADIWSLGICVLELLTGKAAWGRTSDEEIMDKLRKGEKPYGFQRLRSKKDDLGIGWEAIDFLEKCFTRTGDARWSAEKLLDVCILI
ncbi:32122_t:CDS:2 [Gigaspora margarita]|uniref:32122_t:CDS:1 n=1 Tax=Gigaspora margarita TaxID=4874 RepID=A0ABN7UW48_GIGMA|nr:32122_t:CDS:2 [Gigaspora margarita]